MRMNVAENVLFFQASMGNGSATRQIARVEQERKSSEPIAAENNADKVSNQQSRHKNGKYKLLLYSVISCLFIY